MSTKFRRALKTATRLPVRRNTRSSFAPQPGEQPVIILRVQVVGCSRLLAKDRNGSSDPFVVVSVLNERQQTPVSKRSLNPTYSPSNATFNFPLYLSTADKLGALELVVWDKDMLTKEYMGEAALPLEDWFGDRPFGFDDLDNTPFSVALVSSRSTTAASGSIQLKLGFIAPPSNNPNQQSFADVFKEINRRSRPSLVSAPPTEGVGTIRSHQTDAAFQDDGGLSSDDEDDEDDFNEGDASVPSTPPLADLFTPPAYTSQLIETKQTASPTTPTLESSIKTPVPTAAPKTGFMPRMKLPKRISGLTSSLSTSSSPSPVSTPAAELPNTLSTITTVDLSLPEKKKAPKKPSPASTVSEPSSSKKKRGSEFKFENGNDIVGIVMLEVQSADDLPRLKNMTRTGWDMDPFVVISFGKKVFRTRVIRHSRNPVWDEKLLFHVRRYETNFNVKLDILDWDKLSSNDLIGEANFNVKELLDNAPQPGPDGLYPKIEDGERPMKEFKLPLSTSGKEMPWEAKHNPTISFRAKYQPYAALRQQFWRQYMQQYDTDSTGALSHIELTSMLDSLGSTLSSSTLSSFFRKYNKKPHGEDELTYDQTILCLEEELNRPEDQKKPLDAEDSQVNTSTVVTPVLMVSDRHGQELKLDQLDFSGPANLHEVSHDEQSLQYSDRIPAPSGHETEPMQIPLKQASIPVSDIPISSSADSSGSDDNGEDSSASNSAPPNLGGGKTTINPLASTKKARFRRRKGKKSKPEKSSTLNSNTNTDDDAREREDTVERVINVKSCPICHRPRMGSKAEMDIMTHVAVCASQDWNRVDRIVVGNFVTASQAQRKWYTKVLGKLSSGDYKLGANSANIIVQNRETGQLEEEKMQVYVRLGIRLLYKGMKGRMEGNQTRKLLKSMSNKQGVKFDSPESAKDIPSFIDFHKLNVDEILDPLDSFKNFNQFFYRKLKTSARPVEDPENSYRLVSAADCRLMAFETVTSATQIWIKGRDFSVARLLGDNYKHEADNYVGGALGIFRLAPQDYHRFHSPVDGIIGPMSEISGEYYTVNPQAIRTALDVYGENVRKIVPIDSPQFGRVMAVCVGAMMVGSIKTTVDEGHTIKRGEEFGFFAFGGSTVVLLFEKGMLEWDEDLLVNGRVSLETLVKVGTGIGHGTRRPS